MTFKKGTNLVHPGHGVARIVGRERREVDGETVSFLILLVPARDDISREMTVFVPVNRADEVGLRPVVDLDEAEEVLAVLGVKGVRVPSNWSRRFKNHQAKLKSGDLYECAEVVRNLARRDDSSGLSHGEKNMYLYARYRLTTELAAAWGVDDDEAADRIDAALAGKAA